MYLDHIAAGQGFHIVGIQVEGRVIHRDHRVSDRTGQRGSIRRAGIGHLDGVVHGVSHLAQGITGLVDTHARLYGRSLRERQRRRGEEEER